MGYKTLQKNFISIKVTLNITLNRLILKFYD